MKIALKLMACLVAIYMIAWAVIIVLFSNANLFKGSMESVLSSVLKRDLTITTLKTAWVGLSPQFQAQGIRVNGDSQSQDAFAINAISARLNPWSVLALWPVFEDIAVDSPQLEVAIFNDGRVQIAGMEIMSGQGSPQALVDWLLAQQSASWHNGSLIWQREGKPAQRFNNISFVYQKQGEQRTMQAAIETGKGSIAFNTTASGNPFSHADWDATFELLGSGGQRLVSERDFSAKVVDGQGQLSFTTLNIERVQDFLLLAGLTPERHWLLAARVDGRLHDVRLAFTGPLLAVEDWSLHASASNIGFKSPSSAPSMNNLSGTLALGREQGQFLFATRDAVFEWPSRFVHPLPIEAASGLLRWRMQDQGLWQFSIKEGEYSDPSIKVSNFQAELQLNRQAKRIRSFGDLFRVKNVVDLSLDEGQIVGSAEDQPARLDAAADFSLTDVTRLFHYIPIHPDLEVFRKWAEIAFKSGTATNGQLSYAGELSVRAFNQGRARLTMTADFDDAEVDYSPAFRWPAITQASGQAKLENQLLTIIPKRAFMNGDPVTDSELMIERLFERDPLLLVRGKTTTSLAKGMEFVFKGPLIKPELQLAEVPLDVTAGWVDVDVQVSLPLNMLSKLKVSGTSRLYDGHAYLPSKMPLKNINALVRFTEQRIESDNINATFLGGETRAKLETLEPGLPPVMKMTAHGTANAEELEPWLGEHLLSLIKGSTDWQGEMVVEGNSLTLNGESDLTGIQIDVPAPVGKQSTEQGAFTLGLQLGQNLGDFGLRMNYRDVLSAQFQAAAPRPNQNTAPSLFDRGMIRLRDGGLSGQQTELSDGINFDIQYSDLDVDAWMGTVVDLASYETTTTLTNTAFLDALRSINLEINDATFLGRPYGEMRLNALSVDGHAWIGTLAGDHLDGTMHLEPRRNNGYYNIALDRLNIPAPGGAKPPPEPVDYGLRPESYPSVRLNINRLSSENKSLGRLSLHGAPAEQQTWLVDKFELSHNGTLTTATGRWMNNPAKGSLSRFEFKTRIEAAGEALDELDFKGILRKGQGSVEGELSWIGAPHEFDFARLNGDFNAFVKDGELVQVEPGGGRLLGLFNINTIFRRLVFDFSDLTASGLRFDRMRLSGVLADGEAVLQDAFVLSPAVFVSMEGSVDLNQERIDMEVHVSPELGGNIALLSALANPAAGALVFLTQQVFKDNLRKNSFRSFRALGSWDEFELEELNARTLAPANDGENSSAPQPAEPLSEPVGEQDFNARVYEN